MSITGPVKTLDFIKKHTLVLVALFSMLSLVLIGAITAITFEDLLSNGTYVVIGIVGLVVIKEMKNRLLTIGWALYLSGIIVDFLDEVLALPIWLDEYYEDASVGFGLLVIVMAFYLLVKHQQDAVKEFRNLSTHDYLTGLYNHRYFYEYLEQAGPNRAGGLTILFGDLDYFKTINDAHGHIAGDNVLKETAQIIRQVVGTKGTVFRYGGEEFVAVLHNCDSKAAYNLAEEIRKKINASEQLQRYATYLPVTMSIGLATYPHDAADTRELVSKADRAMYFAKQKGRNQCVIYSPEIDSILDQGLISNVKQEMLINSVFSIASAIDAKDKYTGRHSELVSKYALQIAESLKMSEEDQIRLRIGALMHDCGKIGIPDEIINKPGILSVEEFSVIKNHTLLGYNIIKHITDDVDIASCVLYHHERWDGSGYPKGLRGNDIPLFARIICVADTFHAMTSCRPYREALSDDSAIRELQKGAGAQFDPALVERFLDSLGSSRAEAKLTPELLIAY